MFQVEKYENCPDCVLAYLLPHCYVFALSYTINEGCCCSILNCLFCPCTICCLRRKVRKIKGISGNFCKDFVVSMCKLFCL